MDASDRTANELLAHLDWLRALARRLLDDADDADDVAQEAWITATRRSPEDARALRGWLARIVRNLAFMRRRSSQRRAQREQASQRGDVAHADGAEGLLDQARVQQLLATLVVGLQEPYRSTVLLHFYEGLSAAEIARRQGVPAGTVRWRLSQALAQLRRGLDAEAGGDRRRWAIALAPIAEKAAPADAAATGAVGVLKIGWVVAFAAVVALLVLGVTRAIRSGSWASRPTGNGAAGAGSGAAWWRAGAEAKEPGWLVQPGAPSRRVAGRVLFHDAPAPGATVQLFNQLVFANAVPPPTRVTDDNGRFDFGPQSAAFVVLTATAPGRSSDTTGAELADPAARPAPDQIVMTLGDCAAPIDGFVRDASGGPIAGASVCYGIEGGLPSSCTSSNATGRYEFCMNPVGTIPVRVSAPGYGSVLEQIPGHWSRLTHHFALTPESVVRGTVVRASDGKPQPGARVGMMSAIGWMVGAAPNQTITDENGHFTLNGVAAGRHRLSAETDNGSTLQDLDVDVRTGATLEGIQLRVTELPTIRGIVVENGRPVPGASLVLQSGSGDSLYSSRVYSQADGTFVMDRVPRGSASVQSQNHQVVAPTTLRVDKSLDGVRIEVAPQTMVHGHVRSAGKPIAGVYVEAGNPMPVVDRTDANGEFRLAGLPPGAHTLRAATDTASGSAKVKLGRGETLGVDIDLDTAASISGVLVEEDGRPAAGVLVSFSQTQGGDQAVMGTGDDGTFRVGPLLGGGTYRASVKQTELLPTTLPAAGGSFPEVVLRDSSSHVEGVRLVVRRGHHVIAGKVLAADGTPQPDAEIVLVKREPDQQLWFVEGRETAHAYAGLDGNFKLGDLEPGDYGVRARLGAGPEVIIERVAAGTESLTLKLPASATIVGKLVGFEIPPQVIARRVGVERPRHALVSADGFVLRELTAGTYVISAATGESDVAQVDVSGGVTVNVTLTRRPGATVRGRVVDARDGTPSPGMTCNPSVGDPPDGTLQLAGASVSDDDGRFELAVPTGRVQVSCWGDFVTVSQGIAELDVGEHQTVDADVLVVHRRMTHVGDRAAATIGARPVRSWFGFSIQTVKPGTPADRAGLRPGDRLTSVDGVSTDRLCRDGVNTLIDDRPLGTAFPVQVSRSDSTFAASLSLVPRE
jgi:RNA polymerase sigma-70 factor (ECF subfamily)